MLQAISEMLKDTKETKVKCAKIMLDKIIEGRVIQDASPESLEDNIPSRKSQKVTSPKSNEPEYIVAVDQGILLSIKYQTEKGIEEAPDDLAIEVDGKITTYESAKGKKFQSGRVI